jgi:hypothetical protein
MGENTLVAVRCRGVNNVETVMLTQDLLNNLLAKKHDLDNYHAAQLAAVERCPHKIEIAVRTDLIDQFLDQAHEVPGRYSVAPGRVWRSGKHRFRNYLVGWSDFSGPLDVIAIQIRWDCTVDGHIGFGFKA